MTKLINIKEVLTPFFTLRDIKNTVWLSYLKEDVHYVNGEVYFYDKSSTYFSQKVNTVTFTPSENNTILCNVFITGQNIVSEQLQVFNVFNNGAPVNVEWQIAGNKVILYLNNSFDGLLDVRIPPYYDKVNKYHYQGVQFNRTLVGQNLTLVTHSRPTNALNVTVSLTNSCANQQLKVSTLLRNGNTNKQRTISLTEGQTEVTVSLDRGNQDVGFLVELLSITKNNKTYLGGSINHYW